MFCGLARRLVPRRERNQVLWKSWRTQADLRSQKGSQNEGLGWSLGPLDDHRERSRETTRSLVDWMLKIPKACLTGEKGMETASVSHVMLFLSWQR